MGNNVNGYARIEGEITSSSTKPGDDGSVTFNFPGLGELVPGSIHLSTEEVVVTKSLASAPNAVNEGGTEKEWSYLLKVTAKGTNSHVTVEDQPDSKVTFEKGTIQLWTDEECTKEFTGWTAKDGAFPVTIDSMVPDKETGESVVYITYKVKLTAEQIKAVYGSGDNPQIKNIASASSAEDPTPSRDTCTVTLNKKWADKTGTYNSDHHSIDWVILINTGDAIDIGGTTITDVPGEDLEYWEGSLKFEESPDGGKTWSPKADAGDLLLTWEKLIAGAYTFPSGSSKEYRLSYSTRVKNEENVINRKFYNEFKYKRFGSGYGDGTTGPIGVGIGNHVDAVTLTKTCVTLASDSAATNETDIFWKTEFIASGSNGMTGTVLKDTVGKYHRLDSPVTVKEVKDGAETDYALSLYSIKINSDLTGFAITFNQKLKAGQKFNLYYKTKIKTEDFQFTTDNQYYEYETDLLNTASVSSNELDTEEASAIYTYVQHLKKSFAGVGPDGKLYWLLEVRPLKNSTDTAVTISDTIPENTIFATSSVACFEDSSCTTAAPAGIAYAASGRNVNFTISGEALAASQKGQYLYVKYCTTIDDQTSSVGTYSNAAVITVNGKPEEQVNATEKYSSVTKTGSYDASTAPLVKYTIVINEAGIKMNGGSNLTLTDLMGSGLELKRGTIQVNGTNIDEKSKTDPGYSYQYVHDETNNKITITVPDSTPVILTYTALVTLKAGTEFTAENSNNTASFTGYGNNNGSSGYQLTGNVLSASAGSESVGFLLNVYKYGINDTDHSASAHFPLSGAAFELQKLNDQEKSGTVWSGSLSDCFDTFTTDDTGYTQNSATSDKEIRADQIYRLIEKAAPDGYLVKTEPVYFVFYSGQDGNTKEDFAGQVKEDSDGKQYEYALKTFDGTASSGVESSTIEISDRRKTSITAIKKWDDDGDREIYRPASITAELWKKIGEAEPDNTHITATLSDANSWSYTFDNLEAYETKDGKEQEITYSVKEETTYPNAVKYTHAASSSGSATTFTNSHAIAKRDIALHKTWDDWDNLDGKRPDHIAFKIKGTIASDSDYSFYFQNPSGKDEWTVNEKDCKVSPDRNTWSYSITGLPVYYKGHPGSEGEEGHKLHYTIEETYPVSTSYPAYAVTKNSTNIDNTEISLTNTSLKTVYISKIMVGGTEELTSASGVKLEILDATTSNVVIPEWSPDGNPRLVELARDHNYILRETYGIHGSTCAADIEFTVTEDGLVSTATGVSLTDYEVQMNDRVTVLFGKTVTGGSNFLAGAWLQILKAEDKAVLASLPVTETGKTISLDLPQGAYLLHEATPPDGYSINTEDVPFKVDGQGNVSVNEVVSTDRKVTVSDLRKVWFSKKEAGADSELKGVGLQILDKKNSDRVLDSWVTDGSLHEADLPAGSFALHESQVPDGFIQASDILFTVREDGSVTGSSTAGNQTVITMFNSARVNISKFTLCGKKELKGAELAVYRKDGRIATSSDGTPCRWISGETAKEFALGDGSYTLKEISVPSSGSFASAEPIDFAISENGTVTSSALLTGTHTIRMYDAVNLTVSKYALDGTTELAGESFRIVKGSSPDGETATGADATDITSWVSDGKEHKVRLGSGIYTLVEKKAPLGFDVASPITFEITGEGKVTVDGKEMEDNRIRMYDAVKVRLSKQTVGGSEELPGASLKVVKGTRSDGELATGSDGDGTANWISGTEEHTIALRPGIYTMVETAAPTGFAVAESITFTVSEDGTVSLYGEKTPLSGNTVRMLDYVIVNFDKKILNGTSELKNASLKVLQGGSETGTVLASTADASEWISDGTLHSIMLGAGTYTMVETSAPDGYEKSESISFEVLEDGTVKLLSGTDALSGNTVTMQDAVIGRFSKISAVNASELPDAVLKIERVDAAGNVLEERSGWTWTSGTVPQKIGTLGVGIYRMSETKAPVGYDIAESILFRVDEGGKISVIGSDGSETAVSDAVVMTDFITTVTKRVTKEWSGDAASLRPAEILVQLYRNGEAYGDPFKITPDASGNWYYDLTGLPETDLETGKKYVYTVREVSSVSGYSTGYSTDGLTIENVYNNTPGGSGGGNTPGPVKPGAPNGPGVPSEGSDSPVRPVMTIENGEVPLYGHNPDGTVILGTDIPRGFMGLPKTGEEEKNAGILLLILSFVSMLGACALRRKNEKD